MDAIVCVITKRLILILLILLFFSNFNLGWGLPSPELTVVEINNCN